MAASNRFARPLSTIEKEEALKRQLGHLRRSSNAFDQGVYEEAERLSAVAYTLLSDGKPPIKALLEQVGLRSSARFINTGTNSVTYFNHPLCMIREVAGEPRYVPIYDGTDVPGYHSTFVDFDTWWNGMVYRRRERVLTREGLVLALRHQDGGSHVDDAIKDEDYDMMKRIGSDYVQFADGKPTVTLFASGENRTPEVESLLNNPPYTNNTFIVGGHWAAMRQIAWEIDQTVSALGY